jgi:dTDP-4-dehydrorhamnose reductase
MNILVFGYSGQVAQELLRLSEKSTFSFIFLERQDADLLFPDRCAQIIFDHKPSAVINAAARTAVDAVETSESDALVINGKSPGAMAQTCAELSIPFVHISSDYVFDGSGNTPWQPYDIVKPLGAYGRSKLLGEQLVQDSGAQAVIMRTSWVFSSHGSNFVKTMLRLGKERDILNVVGDQVGGPTSASAIAGAVLTIVEALLKGSAGGIFHFSGAPAVSWAEFASVIMDQADIPCKINPILSVDYPTKASRPLNSRLDGYTLFEEFNISQPDWVKGLKCVLNELKEQSHGT